MGTAGAVIGGVVKSLKLVVAALVMAMAFLVVGSIALAQSGPSAPATGNITVRDGINPGEVVVSWDAVPGATHYRIGYVNMVTDYPRATASVTGDWINAFIYVDENARNLPVANGRAEYTVRRLEQGVSHVFTVLTSSNFIDTGGGGTVSSTFAWPPTGSRWQRHTVADRGGATAPAPGFDFVSMYPNCDAVRAHYPGGVRIGSPIYRSDLDSDGDGTACETVDSGSDPEASSGGTDRAALVALYNATDGANWTNNANWLSNAPIGSWHGVTVDGHGRIVSLSLYDNQLTGGIPPELGDLAYLRELHLFKNRLNGPIPKELAMLSHLTRLRLDSNELSGPIPPEFGVLSHLTGLSLYRNQLSGPIPAELGELTSLKFLGISTNQLSGPIPAELGRLTNLETFWLSGNDLSGHIPPELGNLVDLTYLLISGNHLTGCIPAGLWGFFSNDLADLGLSFCWPSAEPASGSVATDRDILIDFYNTTDGINWRYKYNWGTDAPLDQWHGVIVDANGRVAALWLHGNQLRGEIPAELGNLTGLRYLGLHDNQLTAEIPQELGHLGDLVGLNLMRSQLGGPIPSELGNLDRLTYLNLGQNQLEGEIPANLGGLINLHSLYLWFNQLSGSIPTELGSLTNLTRLYLHGNPLSGCIPSGFGRC